jgi:hypothetical protein
MKVPRNVNKITKRKLGSKKSPLRITVICADPRVRRLVGRLIANELEHLVHTIKTDFEGRDEETSRSNIRLLYRPATIVTET